MEHVEFEDDTIIEENADGAITEHLVLFQNLPQLQAQNQRLLKVSRDLARKLEEKESIVESRLRNEESEALAEAGEAIKEMEEELQRQKVLASSFVKERDMYRSMLARQGGGVGGVGLDNSGHQINGASDAGTSAALEEQQSLFETFKTELGIDTARLKQDLTAAQRERDANIIALSKANAQLEFFQGQFFLGYLLSRFQRLTL